MSSTSSPESAAFPSGSNEPECKPSPSVNPTPSVSASCDDTGQMSLFSTTCEPSPPRYFPTPDAGTSLTGHGRRGGNPDSGTQSGRTLDALARYGRLTSYAVDSPARTSAWLERAQALQASEAAYGRSSPELLARYDPDTRSWRTSQLCLDGDYQRFSETWPRSGIVVAGTVSLPALSGRRTGETESGS